MSRAIKKFHDFIGQEKITELLSKTMDGAKARREPMPATLLTGPSGQGKTALARAAAAHAGTEFRKILGRPDIREISIEKPFTSGDVLFIDEIQSTPDRFQEHLFTVIENGIQQPSGVAWVILIAATDQPGRLLDALYKRFVLKLALRPYDEDELASILRSRATKSNLLLSPQAVNALARTCRGIPRYAEHRLTLLAHQWANRGISEYTLANIREFLSENGIDSMGLEPTDQLYLRILFESDGPVSQWQLLARLCVDDDFLERVVEPYLLRLGFIDVTREGRILTPAGKHHLQTKEV